MAVYSQDPDAVLDYLVVWADWLDTGDSIVSAFAFCDNGFEVRSQSFNTSGHTIWLASGNAGQEYTVTSRIWTAVGRKNDQSFIVRIEQK